MASNTRMAEYLVRFNTLASCVGWGEQALSFQFYDGHPEHCRWGETQSCAPNQPNKIHTTPDTEPRRSRTKNPRQTSCIWFNRQPILLQSSPIKLSSQSLSPKPSEPNSI